MRHAPWPQWVCDLCGLRVTGGEPDDHECDELSVLRREMEAELAQLLGEEAALTESDNNFLRRQVAESHTELERLHALCATERADELLRSEYAAERILGVGILWSRAVFFGLLCGCLLVGLVLALAVIADRV